MEAGFSISGHGVTIRAKLSQDEPNTKHPNKHRDEDAADDDNDDDDDIIGSAIIITLRGENQFKLEIALATRFCFIEKLLRFQLQSLAPLVHQHRPVGSNKSWHPIINHIANINTIALPP